VYLRKPLESVGRQFAPFDIDSAEQNGNVGIDGNGKETIPRNRVKPLPFAKRWNQDQIVSFHIPAHVLKVTGTRYLVEVCIRLKIVTDTGNGGTLERFLLEE
jgi:hypothetical protein